MIARTFDHRDGAGVAHGEALAGDAAEIAFALDRPIKHGVADDDRFGRNDLGVARWVYHEPAAREALADIVVGLTLKLEADAARQPRAEALAGRPGELYMDGLVRQPGMAVDLGDLAGQH